MNTTELLPLLSKRATEDLTASSQWINPLPENANALISKINAALAIVKFSQQRCAEEPGGKANNNHFEALTRLKSDIECILSSR